jgi:hypothetical protein
VVGFTEVMAPLAGVDAVSHALVGALAAEKIY